MKLPSKPMIALISIPILILLFFSSNIYGYFRFKHYCSTEGGLRVYEKLERDVGWMAKDKYEARVAAQLNDVGFVRYRDQKDGVNYDIRYLGGNPTRDGSYSRLASSESKLIFYKWNHINESVSDELRLGRSGYEVLNSNANKILARYYTYSYSLFDVNNTVLSAPSGISCFYDPAQREGQMDGFVSALNSAFNN